MKTNVAFAALFCAVPFFAGCGSSSNNNVAPSPSPSASPIVAASPNPLPVFINLLWGARTRNVGIDASRLSSAQSAQIRFYADGSQTPTPSSTVNVNRDANRSDSYSVVVPVGAGKVNADRLLLVEGAFYAGADGQGAVVGTVRFTSTVDPVTGEANNSVAVSSTVRTVELSVPAIKVGQTVDAIVTARDAAGNAVAVSPGSIGAFITNARQNTEPILALVPVAGTEPVRVRGVRAGTTTLTATVDGVQSEPLSVTVVP